MENWDAEKINNDAESFAKNNSKITTHQIRNIYSAVNRVRTDFITTKNTEKIKRELILLKPKLAYAAGRDKVVKPLQELMSDVIDKVVKSENFNKACENFFDFAEAMVAYHKFYSEKEEGKKHIKKHFHK